MTDNAAAEQPVAPEALSSEQQIQIMRNQILTVAWNLYQNYRNNLKQLPIEPSSMSSLLGKLDDSWYMARVIMEDMQINLPAAA